MEGRGWPSTTPEMNRVPLHCPYPLSCSPNPVYTVSISCSDIWNSHSSFLSSISAIRNGFFSAIRTLVRILIPMFIFSGVNCTWGWLPIVERKDLCPTVPNWRWPPNHSVYKATFNLEHHEYDWGCLKLAAKGSLHKAPPGPQDIHPGPRKKTSEVITPSQGGQTRAQSSLLGHGPSTRSVLSNSLWIYCPRMDHMSFFKCSFSPWVTSQNNGSHMFTFHHRNKPFYFIYHKRNESSWNSTKFCNIVFPGFGK